MDDGTLVVKVSNRGGYLFHKFTWGNDDAAGVQEDTVLAAIKLKKAQRAFYEKYKEEINDYSDRGKLREYFAMEEPLNALFYEHCDDENRELWDRIEAEIEERREKLIKRIKSI